MSRKYCFFAVEGPHDQAAITRLLQLAGFEKFKGESKELDPFNEDIVALQNFLRELLELPS